jgi:hypothetical protein
MKNKFILEFSVITAGLGNCGLPSQNGCHSRGGALEVTVPPGSLAPQATVVALAPQAPATPAAPPSHYAQGTAGARTVVPVSRRRHNSR